MAANQRRRRLNGTSFAGGNSLEKRRANKKQLGFSRSDVNTSSHISLEWDERQKRVVSKREQICISRRDLIPFNDFFPHCCNNLADVCNIPREIFELDDLAGVLSHEVWQSHLSEQERKFLMQFLPKGTDPMSEQVVQALLAGDNFHLGNPFLKWGASLCSGNLHPDAILLREMRFKASKRAYYAALQKYHNDMIGHLQKLKERWESCNDPEKEFSLDIWRSRKHSEKSISAPLNGSRIENFEENFGSESYSRGADEKACSSDNLTSSMMKSAELPKSMCRKGFTVEKCQNAFIDSDDVLNLSARARKLEKSNKRSFLGSDGDKYMSYVMISKKQHQLLKSMKQSGKSIQSSSLNRVLGDLDSFHVRPYEVFVEAEQKKLHEHWLQLANRYIPAAFAYWRKGQSEKRQITKSLGQELNEKLKFLIKDEEKGYADCGLQTEMTDRETESTSQDDEESCPAAKNSLHLQPIHSLNFSHEVDSVDVDSGDNHVIDSMDVDSEKNPVVQNADDATPSISENTGNSNSIDLAVSQGIPISSSEDVWPAVSLPHRFFHSTASSQHTSSSGLSLGHPQIIEGQQACLIDLESDIHEEDAGDNLLQKQSIDGAFSSYQNQDQRELFQSFYRGQEISSYNHDQKQRGLDFQQSTNVVMGSDRLPGQFQEQVQQPLPLEERLKRHNEFYMHQNIQNNMYTDEGRFFIPGEQISQTNVQDWGISALQSHSNGGGLLGHNLFPAEQRVRGGWSGSEGGCIPSQNIGNGNNNDESLFSILSQCKALQSSTSYNFTGSTGQFVLSRNFRSMDGGIPRNSNALPQTVHPLDYLSGQEASASQMTNSVGLMNLPHQNSALHDPMGKPFLRSWNH